MKQERLKTLLPTLKENKRYVFLKIISEEPLYYPELESAVWNQLLEFYGELGVANMSIWIIKNLYSEQEQLFVIKCNDKSVSQVISCLGLISRIGDNRVIFKVLKVSGTIKGLKIKVI